MSVKTRFAPSPTGKLHVGNARVALLNWLYARQNGGQFILRLDDTDTERSTEAFADQIQQDLEWLGISWDRLERQSVRKHRYEESAEKLKVDGRLYDAYETPEELSLKRKIQISAGKPPLYDRAALSLSDADKQKLQADGITPHWRFKLNHEHITWHDLVRGDASFQGENLSDPVLIRANGMPIYSLASTVDDIDMGITHVIRGEDHIANTALQVQVCQALGGDVATYCHLPLLSDANGDALSKRFGSLSLEDLRNQGIEPMAIVSHLVRLGSPLPVEGIASIDALLETFDLSKYSKAAPRYSEEELGLVNAKLVHGLSFDAVKNRVHQSIDAAFWQAVQPNLTKVSDVAEWWKICREEIQPNTDELDYTKQAASLLPEGDLTTDTWNAWIAEIKTKTGRKGKSLFMPLRLAITGQNHGPELPNLLPLIGRDRLLKRLNGEMA